MDLDVLARLACGDLDAEEERAAEEHVLDCTPCARVLEGLCVVREAVRQMVVRGGGMVHVPVTPAAVARLEADGLVTRRYVLAPGAAVPCTVGADDVFTLVTLELDVTGVARVDLQIGPVRLAEVPFDAAGGRLAWIAPAARVRQLPTMKIPVRAFAVDPDGGERTIAECVLEHTAQLSQKK
jgi:hypothetical protein